jgi:tetratricopeptide (TPR) repeat protein
VKSRPASFRTLLGAGALVVLTLAAYLPAIGPGFVWDDDQYVTSNPSLQSAAGLRRLWVDIVPDPNAYPMLQYYPLTYTTFWLEAQLWGTSSATPFHLANVLLHALGAVLLWVLLRRLEVPAAWLAAAVFAVHPVHVESVAWVSERKNVLSGVFYLAAMLVYLRWAGVTGDGGRRASPGAGGYALSLALFGCALFSKTVTSSLPAAALLVVWWKRGRLAWRDVLPLVPFFALGLGMGSLTAWMEKHRVGAWGPDWDHTLVERFLIAGRAFWFYAAKLLWPSDLTLVHPRWRIDATEWWQHLFPLAAIGVVVAAWLLRGRVGRGPLAAILFFGGTLFPALGFFDVYPMLFSFVADHFQYLASVGVIVLVAAIARRGAAPWLSAGGRRRSTVLGAAGLVLAVLATLTWRHAPVYADIEALWADTLEKNPDAWMAHKHYGASLLRDARTASEEIRRDKLARAAEHFRTALELKPDDGDAALGLGTIFERQGRLAEATGMYRTAISVQRPSPVGSPAFEHSAFYHFHLARALAAQGQTAEAIEQYAQAVRISPGYEQAQTNLGALLEAQGRHDEALVHLRRALASNPRSLEAHRVAGVALASQGRIDEAMRHWAELMRLQPTNASVPYNMGVVYARAGRFDEAIAHFETALRRQPNFAQAQEGLAAARAAKAARP